MQTAYSDNLIQHSKNPFKAYALSSYHVRYESQNSLCGDEFTLYLRAKDNDRLEEASFEGKCCAVCRTSASIMMKCINDKTYEQIQEAIARNDALKKGADNSTSDQEHNHFWRHLRSFPVRHKCAMLPWNTLELALQELKSRNYEAH